MLSYFMTLLCRTPVSKSTDYGAERCVFATFTKYAGYLLFILYISQIDFT